MAKASSVTGLRRKAINAVFVGFCYAMTAVALIFLAFILWSLVVHGAGGVNLQVFTQVTPAAGSDGGGGLLNAILGSILVCGVGMLLAVVFGVLAGTWLAEFGRENPYAEVVRFVNDILLSAPSVLVGLVVSTAMVAHLIHHFSAFAGSVALALIAVPIITRTTEDVLKLQPTALRESGVALGTPYWIAIRKILWKSAGGGILTGGLLAFARISGETAPLLFTSFGNPNVEWDPSKPVSALPQVIYNFAMSADDNWIRLGWVAALILSAAVLFANIVARLMTRESNRS